MSDGRYMVNLADERLVEALKRRAKREQRSLANMVRLILWGAIRKHVDSTPEACDDRP